MVSGQGRARPTKAQQGPAPTLRPSADDIKVRERTRLGLRVLGFGPILLFCVLGAVSEFVEFRFPLEIMALPGLVGLAAIIACRAPGRRDLELSTFITIAASFSILTGAIAVIAWPGPALGVFWAVSLACALACWTFQYAWRSR